jgi:hypothetical protein
MFPSDKPTIETVDDQIRFGPSINIITDTDTVSCQ